MVEKKEKWLAGPMKSANRTRQRAFSDPLVTLFAGIPDGKWKSEVRSGRIVWCRIGCADARTQTFACLAMR